MDSAALGQGCQLPCPGGECGSVLATLLDGAPGVPACADRVRLVLGEVGVARSAFAQPIHGDAAFARGSVYVIAYSALGPAAGEPNA